jgi:hypothetical protein
MKIEEWEKGLIAWENIKKQAIIDLEQADLYISVIKDKITILETEGKDLITELETEEEENG